jgi:transcriptional regulator with XRE-family HTH domain
LGDARPKCDNIDHIMKGDHMSGMIAANLRRLMGKRGWQQRDLAEAAGLSEASVCRILAGRQDNPTVQTLRALAKALNVSLVDLMGEGTRGGSGNGELEETLLSLYNLLPPEERSKIVDYAEAIVAKRQRDEKLRRRESAVTSEAFALGMVKAR